MNDDMNSLHCKACDSLHAPVWDEDRGEFEELCGTCLTIALGTVYADSADVWLSDYEQYLQDEGVLRVE